MKKQLEEIYKGKNPTVTMDLVPLTGEQLEELIKGQEDENAVIAKIKGKNFKLDSNFNIYELDGVYYRTHNRKNILFADITKWTDEEKGYLRKIILNKLKMKNKRLVENDVVLPLQMTGKIKPKHLLND